jgi:hypothetical protein
MCLARKAKRPAGFLGLRALFNIQLHGQGFGGIRQGRPRAPRGALWRSGVHSIAF